MAECELNEKIHVKIPIQLLYSLTRFSVYMRMKLTQDIYLQYLNISIIDISSPTRKILSVKLFNPSNNKLIKNVKIHSFFMILSCQFGKDYNVHMFYLEKLYMI